MEDEYVFLKSYDDKIVKVPIDKKDEYLRNQKLIKQYLEEGKNLREILSLMRKDNE